MAKAKKQPKGRESSDIKRTRMIKVNFGDDEVKDIRVAAAMKEMRSSQFVRTAALEAARKTLAEFKGGR